MRIIKTYDGITLNCDVIVMIQPVFMIHEQCNGSYQRNRQ